MTNEVEKLRAQFLAASEATPIPLKGIPKSWGDLHVKPLTVADVEFLSSDVGEHKSARGLARVLCTKDGDLLFDEKNPDHIALLQRRQFEVINAVNRANKALGVEEAQELGNDSPPETASSST